ncbi:MAG: cyclase family protein [Bullifex sp.]
MKVLDLTHAIDPAAVQRKFSIERIGADEVNHSVVRKEGQWYIMTNISMVSHIATHIEVPFHLFRDGYDLASMPVESFEGDAVLLDFTHIKGRIPITAEDVCKAMEKAGGINPGDIVICNLGYSSKYGTPEYQESPYFSEEAMEKLVSSGMKMMGVDAGGVEIPKSEEHVNHAKLFSNNIPLIENVANLDSIDRPRFRLCAFPVSIVGVEAFPVRVVAFV